MYLSFRDLLFLCQCPLSNVTVDTFLFAKEICKPFCFLKCTYSLLTHECLTRDWAMSARDMYCVVYLSRSRNVRVDGGIILKFAANRVLECGFNEFGTRYESVVGACEHSSGPSGSVNVGEFLV
jgi:hypothetical protein